MVQRERITGSHTCMRHMLRHTHFLQSKNVHFYQQISRTRLSGPFYHKVALPALSGIEPEGRVGAQQVALQRGGHPFLSLVVTTQRTFVLRKAHCAVERHETDESLHADELPAPVAVHAQHLAVATHLRDAELIAVQMQVCEALREGAAVQEAQPSAHHVQALQSGPEEDRQLAELPQLL